MTQFKRHVSAGVEQPLSGISPPATTNTSGTVTLAALDNAYATQKTMTVNVMWPGFGAKGNWNGTTGDDDTAAIQMAADAVGPYGTVYLPWTPYSYLCGEITLSNYQLLRGDGFTKIQHKDGQVSPLLHVPGGTTGTPMPAAPYGGFEGLRLYAGNQTTSLIYYDGQIDNQVIWRDLQFFGNTSNASVDAISVRDYLNWNMESVRWDWIGGWGIRVRSAQYFGNAHLVVDGFSYDNGSTGSRGQGLISIDSSAVSIVKGPVVFSNGRIEINVPLASSKPSRSLFRAVQNHAQVDAGAGAVAFSLKSVAIDIASAAKDLAVFSSDYKRLSYTIEGNSVIYGAASIFRTDDGTNVHPPSGVQASQRLQNYSSNDRPVDFASVDTSRGINGMREMSYDSDANLASGTNQGGDWAYNRRPWNGGGRTGRTFAAKAVQQRVGLHSNSTPSLGTGAIAASSNQLTMTAGYSQKLTQWTAVTVAGAGSGGADLNTYITDFDYTTGIATLAVNASTTVSGAAVTQTQAETMYVPMVWQGSAIPTGTRISYQVGDVLQNTAPSTSSPVLEWVCTAAGAPGTWRPKSWITTSGATGSRPTLTASDVGVTYIDTTLSQMVVWTGSAWI